MLKQIALVALTKKAGRDELQEVSAALQKQVARDLGPLWNLEATVDAFERIDDAPSDYWKVVVEDFSTLGGEQGIHQTRDGQPYARVAYSNAWSLSASHEVIEMLVDPFLNQVRAGVAIDATGHRVRYLVEVCDPCQDPRFAYTVNGVLVSDFVAPWYFDPVGVPGLSYSFGGHVGGPREVAVGGYLTWFDPILDTWRQAVNVAGSVSVGNLQISPTSRASLRERINRATRPPDWWSTGIDHDRCDAPLKKLLAARETARSCHRALARTWRTEVYGKGSRSRHGKRKKGSRHNRTRTPAKTEAPAKRGSWPRTSSSAQTVPGTRRSRVAARTSSSSSKRST